MSHSDWPTRPNLFFGSSPKYKFLCEDSMVPLWPPYIVEKGKTLGKPCEIRLRIANID